MTPPVGKHALHGRDLIPLLKDPAASWNHPCLYEHTGEHYGGAVAAQLAANPQQAIYQKVPWYTAVIHADVKYVRYLQPGVPDELYDLRRDPAELHNLAADVQHAKTLASLREVLASELKRTGAAREVLPVLAP
jgi:arylsulfatase A-like enzyme